MKGKLIVFDGNDGSGKQTQMKRMIERLQAEGKKVHTLDFPRYYDNFFGKLIGEGLTGAFGKWTELPPKLASIPYAADRFESKQILDAWLEAGDLVLLDRYASANQIHQTQKFNTKEEQKEFLDWLVKMEFEVFKIPKPDTVLYFDVTVPVSLDNLKKKNPDKYKEGKEDSTETDVNYLTRSRQCAQWIAGQDSSWVLINCMDGESMRGIDDIHAEVYEKLSKEL